MHVTAYEMEYFKALSKSHVPIAENSLVKNTQVCHCL